MNSNENEKMRSMKRQITPVFTKQKKEKFSIKMYNTPIRNPILLDEKPDLKGIRTFNMTVNSKGIDQNMTFDDLANNKFAKRKRIPHIHIPNISLSKMESCRKYYFNDEEKSNSNTKDIIFYKQWPNFKEEVFLSRFYLGLP